MGEFGFDDFGFDTYWPTETPAAGGLDLDLYGGSEAGGTYDPSQLYGG